MVDPLIVLRLRAATFAAYGDGRSTILDRNFSADLDLLIDLYCKRWKNRDLLNRAFGRTLPA
jgi:hypothetical protein